MKNTDQIIEEAAAIYRGEKPWTIGYFLNAVLALIVLKAENIYHKIIRIKMQCAYAFLMRSLSLAERSAKVRGFHRKRLLFFSDVMLAIGRFLKGGGV